MTPACYKRRATSGAISAEPSIARAGIGRGERVGLFLPNVPEFALAYHALVRLGAVAVSINVMSRRDEVRHILVDSAAAALVNAAFRLPGQPRQRVTVGPLGVRKIDPPLAQAVR